MNLVLSLASSEFFMPHGHCYLWRPDVLWLNVASDALIAVAYFAIPFVLLQIARRRPDLLFRSFFVWFSIFIVSCGMTHLIAAWNVWHADYWLEGFTKLATAAASLPTAWLLWRALPAIVNSPSLQQLKDSNDSLARANREMEAFSASVSHDLRSPLSSIAGQTGLLELSLGNQVTEEQKRRIERVQTSVKQMSELIEALLVLSRISRQSLQCEAVDMSLLAEETAAELRQREPARAVAITIQPGITLRGDKRLLATALTNLIGNAWKFTRKTASPQITVGMTHENSLTTLHVQDNGAGFDMAYQEKLFKPFQRLHSPTEFPGCGVGLATVQRIVERHGGRVWAHGKPQQGATFFCTLPD